MAFYNSYNWRGQFGHFIFNGPCIDHETQVKELNTEVLQQTKPLTLNLKP